MDQALVNKRREMLLCIFLGWAGIHRFYSRRYVTGIIWFFTAGILGIGWFVDVICEIVDYVRMSSQYDAFSVYQAVPVYAVRHSTAPWGVERSGRVFPFGLKGMQRVDCYDGVSRWGFATQEAANALALMIPVLNNLTADAERLSQVRLGRFTRLQMDPPLNETQGTPGGFCHVTFSPVTPQGEMDPTPMKLCVETGVGVQTGSMAAAAWFAPDGQIVKVIIRSWPTSVTVMYQVNVELVGGALVVDSVTRSHSNGQGVVVYKA